MFGDLRGCAVGVLLHVFAYACTCVLPCVARTGEGVSDHVQGSVTLEDHSRASALFNVTLAESLPSSVSVTELEALA